MHKKILIFIDHFLPGYRAGGPVTSIANMVKLLENDLEIIVATSNKDFGSNAPYDNVEYDTLTQYKNYNVIYLSKINLATFSKTIEEIDPDIIYLNSIFSTFSRLAQIYSLKNKFRIPIILAPRGELQENALAIKVFKKKVYLGIYKLLKIPKHIHFHATDPIEHKRIKELFSTDDIVTISNIPKIIDKKALSKEVNELKLLYISRIMSSKNLLLALNILSMCKHTIEYDIYGPVEDTAYWEECQKMIAKLPNNIIIAYKGILKPSEVSNTMKKYHALLLPTVTENFGHVIVEAMQSGLVPIISNNTPWLDLEKHHAGWDIDLANKDLFIQAIDTLHEMNDKIYSNMSHNTIEYIDKKLNIGQLKEKYTKMFTYSF